MKTEAPFLSRVVLSAAGVLSAGGDRDDDTGAALAAQTVKHLPAMQETQV